MKVCARLAVLLYAAAKALAANESLSAAPRGFDRAASVHYVTQVAQFRELSGADYFDGCDFRLTGVVTLVDARRNLIVIQDETGAVALSFPFQEPMPEAGQLVSLEGTNCCPYCSRFPRYPFRPTAREMSSIFEAPANTGEYHLTRMRGYLHPPATGEYRFWIASDNSSELWLSSNAEPSKARKIAGLPRFGWVAPREWSRYESQCSGPIVLNGGESYYIEAIAEQTTGGDNLAVAWQGPGVNQSVIPGTNLTPSRAAGAKTNGILREYWADFTAGELVDVAGPRPFQSALAVEQVRMSVLGQGAFPSAQRIALDQEWNVSSNYLWVQAEGRVKFAGTNESGAMLELSDGRGQAQIRAPAWAREKLWRLRDARVRVEGVCEGSYDQKGTLVPGLIWVSEPGGISLAEMTGTNSAPASAEERSQPVSPNSAAQGFYVTRVVVTFNERVLEHDYIFVQEDAAAMLVMPQNPALKSQFEVGRWLELGGTLEPGKYVRVIGPLTVTDLGRHSLPPPLAQPVASSGASNLEGRWSEIEGVVHTVNTNGTLSALTREGVAYLWMGQTETNCLTHYVDGKLRARGVLLLTLLDAPLLLVPSRDFIDVEEEAPGNPFDMSRRPIAEVIVDGTESTYPHRVRVAGKVTYRDAQSFFVEDATAGIRVRTSEPPAVSPGQMIEVVAFPSTRGFRMVLTEPLLRPMESTGQIKPKRLDLNGSWSARESGTLVQINGTLLGRKSSATDEILELQQQQRVFVASLARGAGTLPDIVVGSKLQVTGVCEDETTATPSGEKSPRAQMLTALNILLRSPADVAVLAGPPWWNWRRTATLVGSLLTVLVVALLWVRLLHRRLERQQAAQVAFSRHVLERLEDERRRIAVNLHDSLGQILMAIKYCATLAIQRSRDEEGVRQRLDEISGITSQAIEEVRQITHGLRPYQLDRLGLTQAIRASVNRASATGSIVFASRVEDIDGLFDKDAEIHVYRIVQEAVTNVVKHSAATEATVVLKKRPGMVLLSIRDNGRGFDPAARRSSATPDLGYGLSGIAERVRILGGTLSIDSRPGEGVSFTVEVPVSDEQAANETGNHSLDRG